ncbi:hypothetical protein G7K71_17895 [Desulfofundulus sp. TPOSR]|uniref:Uncharacterized protein n=1 Tax=Desulfofundulus kuznetsovii (strain DSM 6115 / VKM B-1805 / 17) TaxID=760568 RepID=A0AAU8PKL9_DESK7|nr:hypothetical protein [Desulfofundulus sp. TPOSR]AEG16762.1 hypothetical protein Desku_3275 [Desulfofundulus kuznetsovii DSM 6115]NHM28799.1 hypothetical protein [Desulfofundulus sp. TPOSR]
MAIFCPGALPCRITGVVVGALIAALALVLIGIMAIFNCIVACPVLFILAVLAFILGIAIIIA